MPAVIVLAEAQLLDLSLSFLAEVVAFILMILILARWIYPWVMQRATERQRQIQQQLEDAERARQEAERRLQEAERRTEEARRQADEIIAGASRAGEQLRGELKQKAEEEARRMTERAQKEIEAEKQKAIDAVRGDVADLVVAATAKVVGESLDGSRHRELIEQAIQQAGGGERKR